MVSNLPPRLRDTIDIQDRVRQDRANLGQLFVGFQGGRFPPSRRLGADASQGVFDNEGEDDDTDDEQTPEWEFNDYHLVTTAGGQVPTLSKAPLDESLQVYWHPRGLTYGPLRWSADKFTVNGQSVTIPDADGGLIEVGDAFSFQYQYLTGEPSNEIIVDWGSNGPNKIVAEGDTTNYSALAYDDSAWASGDAPVGFPVGSVASAFPLTWIPAVTSSATANSGMWVRRHFSLPYDALLNLQGRADGQYWFYLDGVLLDSYTGAAAAAWEPSVNRSVVAGDHVIALHVNDDTPDPGVGDYVYADVYVEEVAT